MDNQCSTVLKVMEFTHYNNKNTSEPFCYVTNQTIIKIGCSIIKEMGNKQWEKERKTGRQTIHRVSEHPVPIQRLGQRKLVAGTSYIRFHMATFGTHMGNTQKL